MNPRICRVFRAFNYGSRLISVKKEKSWVDYFIFLLRWCGSNCVRSDIQNDLRCFVSINDHDIHNTNSSDQQKWWQGPFLRIAATAAIVTTNRNHDRNCTKNGIVQTNFTKTSINARTKKSTQTKISLFKKSLHNFKYS